MNDDDTFSWSDDDALDKVMAEMQAEDDARMAPILAAMEASNAEYLAMLEMLSEPPVIEPDWLT